MFFVNIFMLTGMALICYTYVFKKVWQKKGDVSERELAVFCCGLTCDLVRVNGTIHHGNGQGYTIFGVSGLVVLGLMIFSGSMFVQKIIYEDKGSADLERVRKAYGLVYALWWLALGYNLVNLLR